jgi:hypothetical protein
MDKFFRQVDLVCWGHVFSLSEGRV